jgi:hypothetical protein
LSAWAESPEYTGPILLLVEEKEMWIGVTDDGKMVVVPNWSITVDWRFDWKRHEWREVSGLGQEEPADDGGPEFSGSIPDTEGTSGRDSIDEEGGSATGGPWDLDAGEAPTGAGEQ